MNIPPINNPVKGLVFLAAVIASAFLLFAGVCAAAFIIEAL